MKTLICQTVDAMTSEAVQLAKSIHGFAETAGEEVRSSALLSRWLEEKGFAVERGLGSQSTAFRAQWGTGSPTIGFLCEYDALPGLACNEGGGNTAKPGHGCGHNLLGSGSALAAVALKRAVEQAGCGGQIIVYGTPAEETLYGKTCLRREGFFTELDAALAWHPADFNRAGELTHKAIHSVVYEFAGRSAHASVCPELGRSALDACELLNVGVNYLREHVPTDVRMHYGYLNAGSAPNVVSPSAAIWYFLRAGSRTTADEVLVRVDDAAKGAALMSGTRLERRILASTEHTKINHKLTRLAYANMQRLGGPGFTEQERDTARVFAEKAGVDGLSGVLKDEVIPLSGRAIVEHGSTDFSDVSQLLPSIELFAACYGSGTPGHHWTVTAQADLPAAFRGMTFAAKALAMTGWDLIEKPEAMAEVKGEFAEGKARENDIG